MLRLCLCLFCCLPLAGALGQEQAGVIVDQRGESIAGAHVENITGPGGAISTKAGRFSLPAQPGDSLRVTHVGYEELVVSVKPGLDWLELRLLPGPLGLDEAVVSASGVAQSQQKAPILVSRIQAKTLQKTQSMSLAEGLHFSPGLRVENNCQNCGFTQVRMNGLAGPYTQILINSRPIFSSLMGVYGLEMFPPNMIERIEVVRGGGSVLYGGNAIAGTINLITAEPDHDHIELGSTLQLLEDGTPQFSNNINASLVSDKYDKGAHIYAFQRRRSPYDANGDGFTELPILRSTVLGGELFWKPRQGQKISLQWFFTQEDRRGGNDLDLEPHQADLAESLQHGIGGGGLTYEGYSTDKRHRWSTFFSGQSTNRASYYGGGGRVLGPGDSLTEADLLALNAYGSSQDLSLVGGGQYHWSPLPRWTFSSGIQWRYQSVQDRMTGYQRRVDQSVTTLGQFVQLSYFPIPAMEILGGFRYDHVRLAGSYQIAQDRRQQKRTFHLPVPRLAIKYQINEQWGLRSSYARGYRTPQAFDEDLHIETVGGAALFVQLSDRLKSEFSNSFNASLSFQKQIKGDVYSASLEYFHTRLINPFINSDQRELANGTALIVKRNGAGARVTGINAEFKTEFSAAWTVQSGLTWQRANYQEKEVLWQSENSDDTVVAVTELLRTPQLYAYGTATYRIDDRQDLDLNLNFTGAMLVPHVVDTETEFTRIERSPSFWDLGLRYSYRWPFSKGASLELSGGIKNALNAYQSDFDRGPERDSNYIYGPLQPRTFTFGLKLHLE